MDNLLTNPITTWREGRHTSERVLGHDTRLCRNLVLCVLDLVSPGFVRQNRTIR